ncbi:maleate cis-trans isomerase family protein [Ancylobacter sp. VNQ12]
MPHAIGVIVPSSNRVVERVTRAILGERPYIDACFTRVPYAGHPPDGYDMTSFEQAARLLAQARPDVILWNATRGALIGFEPDRRLCAAIEGEAGIPCTTTALATVDLLRRRSLRRIGLVAQGDDEDGRRLKQTFAQEGIEIVVGHNFGIEDNFEAASVGPQEIETQVGRLAATAELDAVLIWSTNLAGHGLTSGLGERLGIPVLDSAALGILHALPFVTTARAPAMQPG